MNQPHATQTVLEQIAERIVSFDLKAITPQAIMLSRTAIIDTLGVSLAGAIEPCTTNLLRTPGVASAPGVCTIFGTAQKTSALDATFINGTASHALDYDDFSQPMGGHQSAPLVAPLMAIAEERGASGLELLQSYVVGIETEIRLARAVNFYHLILKSVGQSTAMHQHSISLSQRQRCSRPASRLLTFSHRM